MRITIQKHMEKMNEAVEKILSDGSIHAYLKSIVRFSGYSFANTLLIFLQKPDATNVAGLSTWNRLGRRVKKDEKGIMVFAPLFSRPGRNKDNRESEMTQKPEPGATEDKASRLIGFKAVYVFDVSQTYGKDLPVTERPEFHADKGIDVNAFYDRVMASCPVPVIYKDIGNSARGCYEIESDKIIISTSLTALEKPKTLIHEIAHKLAYESGEHSWQVEDRPMAEVIAEGAAYIVCSYYGIDTGAYSFRYVALWGQDVKKIMSWGKAVMRVANIIIDSIDGRDTGERKAA